MGATKFKTFLDENLIKYCENEKMDSHTSFNIGGEADFFVCPDSTEKLQKVLCASKESNLPVFILGNGSNLLVSDKGIEGVVISTACLKKISLISDTEIFAEAGASLTAVCVFAKEHSLSGLEFAYGIPGSIGGALYMNAGAYGGEMIDVVSSAQSISADTLSVTERTADDMNLGYRHSIYKENGEIITGVYLKLTKGDKKTISNDMNNFMQKRKTSQPLEYPSAGSTFKRPEGYYAAALIDTCGLKGRSVGGAQVSVKHAGFVINKDNATCDDVLALIDIIKNTVLQKEGVELNTEVIFVGR